MVLIICLNDLIQVQHQDNGGKCGLCGDAYNAKTKLFETGGECGKNDVFFHLKNDYLMNN